MFVSYVVAAIAALALHGHHHPKPHKVNCHGNERYLLCYYRTAGGMSLAGAAGVIGNQEQESHLDPAIDVGGQIGISQWTGDRAAALFSFCGAAHLDSYGLHCQAAYTLYELRRWYGSLLGELRSTGSPTGAAADFDEQYERPACLTCSLGIREGYAQAAYVLGLHS